MGESTSCNFCTYRAIQRQYGKRNVRTRTDPLQPRGTGERPALGWRGVRVEVRVEGAWKDAGAWFAELGDHCEC